MSKTKSAVENQTERFILNGSDQLGLSKETRKVYYPADQATEVGEYYLAQPEQLELIEKSAEQGFRVYRHSSPVERMKILNNLADLIQKNETRFAELITKEAGKPITLSETEVKRAIEVCRGYARELERQSAPRTVFVNGREARIGRFPLGPVLAITPFNFPLNLVIHKLAPAIAAGCSFTLKPDPKTTLTALLLGRLALEAGYTAISIVPVGNDVAEALVKSDSFAHLSFTGSDKVGWYLKSIAGKKTVTLELGGNAAVIIEDFTEPLEAIANRVAWGAYAYAGQICISVQRILVNKKRYDEVLPVLKEAIRALKVGDPMDPKTVVGPLITVDDLQRTRNILKNAINQGANVVYGGNSYNMFTLNPALLDRTLPEMLINTQESFAPVATIDSYENFEEALDRVNASRYGLQAGVYVADQAKIELAFQRLDVGGVIINDIPTFRLDALPYGGVKDSGLGREGYWDGVSALTYEKVLIQKAR